MNTNGDGLRKLGALHSVRVNYDKHESYLKFEIRKEAENTGD
jgi:hypothetical protein